MRRVALLATVLMAWLVLLPAPAYAADPGVVTDDPAGERSGSGTGFDGAGLSSVTAHLGSQAPADRAQRQARNVSVLGALKLEPFNQGVHGDVAGSRTWPSSANGAVSVRAPGSTSSTSPIPWRR